MPFEAWTRRSLSTATPAGPLDARRIALIGCGRWGRNILRDLQALGCQTAVADLDAEARRIASDQGARPVVGDIHELPDSHGIVVATPSSTHAAVVNQALIRNVPVFVEKPFTTSSSEAWALAARAPDSIFVMDKWRYHPGIAELRRIARDGDLGRPLGMHLVQVGWGNPHRDVDVVWILLPHCLSIILEVFGVLPEARQAFGEERHGVLVELTGHLGEEPWASVEVSARSPVKRREFRLECEQGVAWLDGAWTGQVSIMREAGAESRPVSGELPLLSELRAFVEYLQGGPPPRSSAREGALITERVSQMRELARRRG